MLQCRNLSKKSLIFSKKKLAHFTAAHTAASYSSCTLQCYHKRQTPQYNASPLPQCPVSCPWCPCRGQSWCWTRTVSGPVTGRGVARLNKSSGSSRAGLVCAVLSLVSSYTTTTSYYPSNLPTGLRICQTLRETQHAIRYKYLTQTRGTSQPLPAVPRPPTQSD